MLHIKKLIILLFIAGVTLLVTSKEEYIEIPSTSIRIRVIANSNTEEDQETKLIIKSKLEEFIYNLIGDASSYQDVDSIINTNQDKLKENIEETISNYNLNTTFSANYGYNFFPEKTYKGLVYSAGNYKSYVVTLGEGNGDNWWCVLFPPLCLIDENSDTYEYSFLIKEVLDKYN